MEEWREIPGYGGAYVVSNWGNVNGRNGPLARRRKDCGHLHVALYRDGERSDKQIHCLVAEAFIGPRPPGKIVMHLDDIKAHNHRDNLQYGTHSQNVALARANGRRD